MLIVEAAAADGRTRAFLTPFSRNNQGQIELATTVVNDETQYNGVNLEPIRRAWRARQGNRRRARLFLSAGEGNG